MPQGAVRQLRRFTRPCPPNGLRGFAPSRELADWLTEVFLATLGPLFNPDHQHLQDARLGVLWTSEENRSRGLSVAATAEIPRPPQGVNAWQRARFWQQIQEWFGEWWEGEEPDFILTFSAPILGEAGDAEFCAVVEHELYHCGQKEEEGEPLFHRETGRPLWCLKPHDVEEFVGVTERYGAGVSRNVSRMVEAGRRTPTVAPARLALACGLCLGKAA